MKQNTLLPDSKLIQLPRAVGSSYSLWTQGTNLKSLLPHNTFYRHRKLLLDHGIDINFPCGDASKNNVIPLFRVLEARPVATPDFMSDSVVRMPDYFLRAHLLRKIS